MSDVSFQSPRALEPNRKASSGEMISTMARAMSKARWSYGGRLDMWSLPG